MQILTEQGKGTEQEAEPKTAHEGKKTDQGAGMEAEGPLGNTKKRKKRGAGRAGGRRGL